MAGIHISPTGKTLLRKASRKAIGSYFQSLTQTERATIWLQQANRYRVACTQQYLSDLKANSVDNAAMVAYVAASGPGHVVDGWSFLGRSIDALLRNDVYSAIHFGYYAELRAAMAILAAEGIGILNDRHPVVTSRGIPTVIPDVQTTWNPNKKNGKGDWDTKRAGTHAIVWPCIGHWSGLQKSFDLIDEVFRPAGVSLVDWLAKLGSTMSARAITKKWISIWGVDLSLLETDHESRNLVSYRPSTLRPPQVPRVDESLEFVSSLWKCFEPSSFGRFVTFERHLIRRALRIGQVTFPVQPGALSHIGIYQNEEAAWLGVLNSSNEPRFFDDAEKTSALESKGCHFQVLSRATLLLNLATAAARRHLREASITSDDLKFWWYGHGVERGLWDLNSVTDPLDSWADIDDMLRDTDSWLAANGHNGSLAQWRKDRSSSLSVISAFELVGMWGLLP